LVNTISKTNEKLKLQIIPGFLPSGIKRENNSPSDILLRLTP
jgi:hypothetical protein